MRKTVLLLPMMALLATTAVAQPLYSSKNKFSQHTAAALKGGNSSQNKTTGAMERISATSTYSIDMGGGGLPSLELSDSTKYKYSNGRGSSFDPAELSDMESEISEFVLFDSSWKYEENGSGMALSEILAATFNAGNKRTSLVSYSNKGGSQLSGDIDYRYEYNADGNISIEHKLVWNQSKKSWDSASRTYYDYNAQKKIQQERIYNTARKAWDKRITYLRSMSGTADTILTETYTTGWAPTSREIHAFTSGKLNTSLAQKFQSSAWTNDQLDTFGYTTGVNFYTFAESREWDVATSAWVKSSQQVRTLNTQKLIAVDAMRSWDSATSKWETDAELKWTYNSSNKPVRLDMSSPKMPLPIPFTRVHMYYETYFPTKVAQLIKNTPVAIYPNPATDKLTISFDQEKTSAAVVLTNMAGQVVSNTRLTANNGTVEVSLQGLQSGVYNVSVQFADGSVSSQRVIKQ